MATYSATSYDKIVKLRIFCFQWPLCYSWPTSAVHRWVMLLCHATTCLSICLSVCLSVSVHLSMCPFVPNDATIDRCHLSRLYVQYHGCWWPAKTRSKGISSCEINLVLLEYCGSWVRSVNSLWSADTIWCQTSWPTLVQVMDYCLMAPSHYLN